MVNVLNKYTSMIRMGFLDSLSYRFDFLLGSIGTLVYVFVYSFLWKAIYAVYQVPNLTYAQVMWYFLFVQALRSASGKSVKDITKLIQTGDIVYSLNKPYSLFGYQFSTSLGQSLFRLFLILFFGSMLLVFLVGPIHFSLVDLPFILIISLCAMLISFFMQYLIACTAFWLEDSRPIYWIYEKVLFIFGGLLFPLALLPGWLQNIAQNLPTAYFLYFPSILAVDFSFSFFLTILCNQIMWILVLSLLTYVVVSLGYKKMSVNGG